MFKIEYKDITEKHWKSWMTVSTLIAIVNERRRLQAQGYEVRVLNSKGEQI